jgi:hypothetical protein
MNGTASETYMDAKLSKINVIYISDLCMPLRPQFLSPLKMIGMSVFNFVKTILDECTFKCCWRT